MRLLTSFYRKTGSSSSLELLFCCVLFRLDPLVVSIFEIL
jgi:hypothetical protein